MNYIYCLVDPRTEEVHYVGKSVDPKNRWSGTGRMHTPAGKWVHGLYALGLRPRIVILEQLEDEAMARARERWWMDRMWWRGEPLLNISYGEGKGAIISPLSHVGDAARANNAAAHRSENLSAEIRARISAGQKRRYENLEERAKVGRASLGRRHSAETRETLSHAAKRRCASPEGRAQMLEVSKRRWANRRASSAEDP